MNAEGKKSRMANMELLRIVSMLLVVVLHYLGKGNLLPSLADDTLPWTAYYPWLIEAFAIVAVNVYMLLTGYFLVSSSFKVSRLIKTVLQVWFYSVIIGLLAGCFGLFPEEGLCIHYLLSLFFPISMNHYWFMTAYVFMYLFTPFIAAGIKRLDKKQIQIVIGLLLMVFCVIKSVVPGKMDADMQGYDCVWYMCLCVAGAYIRLYGFPVAKNRKRGIAVWGGFAAVSFVFALALRLVYLKTGQLGTILTVGFNYNHLFALAASLGAFCLFTGLRIKSGMCADVILRIAPYTLGVYLLHEHLALRYRWQEWLGSKYAANGLWLIPWLVLAAGAVFVAGIAADMVRSLLFGALHGGLLHIPFYRKLTDKIGKIDERMAQPAGNGGSCERKSPDETAER